MNSQDFESVFQPITDEELQKRQAIQIQRRSKFSASDRNMLNSVLGCYGCPEYNCPDCIECELTAIRWYKRPDSEIIRYDDKTNEEIYLILQIREYITNLPDPIANEQPRI